MNIQYRLGIEQKAAACRSEVLALIEDYLGDTGVHGEPFLAMILSLDGVTVPADAGPLEISGPVKAPALALPTPQDDGDLTDDEVAEIDEMVAKSNATPAAPRQIDRPTVKDKPLTDDEIAEVLERDARGEGSGAIAAAVGRDPRGFYHTVNALRAAAEADAEEAEDEPEPPAEEPATERPFIFEPDPAAPLKERSLHAMLNAVGYPEPFTPALDLRLVELIASGWTASGAAAEVGISTALARLRWNALLPEKGIDQQALLLKALKVRAAAYIVAQGGGA